LEHREQRRQQWVDEPEFCGVELSWFGQRDWVGGGDSATGEQRQRHGSGNKSRNIWRRQSDAIHILPAEYSSLTDGFAVIRLSKNDNGQWDATFRIVRDDDEYADDFEEQHDTSGRIFFGTGSEHNTLGCAPLQVEQ
jgi:hypothetical protein